MAIPQYHLFTEPSPVLGLAPLAWVYPWQTVQLPQTSFDRYWEQFDKLAVYSASASLVRLYFSKLANGEFIESQVPAEDLKFTTVVRVGSSAVFSETIAPAKKGFVDLLLGDTRRFEPVFVAEISGTTLNVLSIESGVIAPGMELLTSGPIASGTKIIGYGTGTGGVGAYTLNIAQNRTTAAYCGIRAQVEISITANSNNSIALPKTVLPWSVNFVGTVLPAVFSDIKSAAYAVVVSRAKTLVSGPVVMATQIEATANASTRLSGAFEALIYSQTKAVVTSAATLQGGVPLVASAQSVAASSTRLSQSYGISSHGTILATIRGTASVGSPVGLQASLEAVCMLRGKNLIVEQRVSGMVLYVSLNTRSFVASPVLLEPISELYFTRRDIEALDVKFVRDGVVVDLSFGATGKIGIKNSFDGSILAIDQAWEKRGEGTDATYQFSMNLNTEEIDSLFETDEETSVVAKVEMEWSEGGTINTTMPCTAVIYNDVLRGTEAAPVQATIAAYFDLRADDNSVWRVTVDEGGSLTATKQP